MANIEPIPQISPLVRLTTSVLPPPKNMPPFAVNPRRRSYNRQYSSIYFARLTNLRRAIEKKAPVIWSKVKGNPILVPRVLEVTKSQICYIVGTVYLDMPLKPNVMDDIARDHSMPSLPPPDKFYSPDDEVYLEDESGRIRLTGTPLKEAKLVTGVIIGALGMETPDGEFEVVDICYPGLSPQTPLQGIENLDRMDLDEPGSSKSGSDDEWIGIISGLTLGSPSQADGPIQMLIEYLAGEQSGSEDNVSASHISRLVVAGDSIAPIPASLRNEADNLSRKARKQAQDSTVFTVHPLRNLANLLTDVASVMPIHILPGATDPSGTIMPQQPFPRGMFGAASTFSSFSCETNPTYLHLAAGAADNDSQQTLSRTFLIHSGQPLNDMFKYLPSSYSRLDVLESTLRWRHMAPTAPDTLWCHPFFDVDPFIMEETPHVYIAGGQDQFATRMAVDDIAHGGDEKTRCRLILVPSFARTGTLVLLNLRTLNVKTLEFAVRNMTGDGRDKEPEANPAPASPIRAQHYSPDSSPPMSTGSPMD